MEKEGDQKNRGEEGRRRRKTKKKGGEKDSEGVASLEPNQTLPFTAHPGAGAGAWISCRNRDVIAPKRSCIPHT